MSKPRPLSDLVPGLTKDILGKKSLLFGKMIVDWPQIAGADIAAKTLPLELKYSKKIDQKSQVTLHLAVQSAYALEISYQKALLIERLNMFFGYPAIKDIKMIQQTNIMSNKKAASVAIHPLTVKEEQVLDEMLAKVKENDLQTALKNLGKAILSRSTDKNMEMVKK
jgi:hypothetical protein